MPTYLINYIGIPYKLNGRSGDALDCWGIILKWYKEQHGIELPDYYGIDVTKARSGAILNTELYKHLTVVTEAKEGDIIILNNAGQASHVGLAIDNEHMLHTFSKAGSVIESFRSDKWNTRIHKIYRHPALS